MNSPDSLEQLQEGLSRPRLPALDGLRAIAAFLVVFSHLGFHGGGASLGVLVFFVLSGFLITRLLIAEEEEHGQISLRAFYARRSLRIFPAFYAYWFLLVISLWLFHKRLLLPQALCSFFYVNNYYQGLFGDPQTGLSHTWSLAVEEQFYLIWPFLFLAFKQNRRRLRFLMVVIPCLWIYREIMVFVFHVNQGYVYEAFDMRADHLLIGCWLAVALALGAFQKLWRFLCSFSGMPFVTVVLLAAEQVIAHSNIPRYRDWGAFLIEPLLVAALLPQLIAFRSGPITRLLEMKGIRYLGRISYSIYLYQQLVIYPVEKMFRGRPVVTVVVSVGAVIACATASYFLVERPFLKLKDRFRRSRVEGTTAVLEGRTADTRV
jgi:peptidoglycan/LPS O-acetylase OafA/YrhL